MGLEHVFQLHKQCYVQFIVGLDDTVSNTCAVHLDLVKSRQAHLQSRILGFQRLEVPTSGSNPHLVLIAEALRGRKRREGLDFVRRRGDYGNATGASPLANGAGERVMMRRLVTLLATDLADRDGLHSPVHTHSAGELMVIEVLVKGELILL